MHILVPVIDNFGVSTHTQTSVGWHFGLVHNIIVPINLSHYLVQRRRKRVGRNYRMELPKEKRPTWILQINRLYRSVSHTYKRAVLNNWIQWVGLLRYRVQISHTNTPETFDHFTFTLLWIAITLLSSFYQTFSLFSVSFSRFNFQLFGWLFVVRWIFIIVSNYTLSLILLSFVRNFSSHLQSTLGTRFYSLTYDAALNISMNFAVYFRLCVCVCLLWCWCLLM